MDGLWSELGKKLAERWLSLLVLPGALFLAVATVAVALGYDHALDIGLLTRKIGDAAKNPAVSKPAGQAIVLVAVLAAAAMIGLLAQALGAVVERVVLAAQWDRWHRPLSTLTGWWVKQRRGWWDNAHRDYRDEDERALSPNPSDRPDPAARRRAARRRDRIATEQPQRPTWSGDRINAVAVRLDREYQIDLATVWPFTWLILPEHARQQVSQARTGLTRSTTLAAWSMLYLPMTIRWWPALVIASLTAIAARHRIRSCVDAYAQLLEATIRLYATSLADELRLGHTGALTKQLGRTLTHTLQQSPLPPPPADH